MSPMKSSVVATALALTFAMAPDLAHAHQVPIPTTAAQAPGPASCTAMTTACAARSHFKALIWTGMIAAPEPLGRA